MLSFFFFSLVVDAAPLCSVIFSHDFFVDEFADVRHSGALDTFVDLNRRWMMSPKQIPAFKAVPGSMPERLSLQQIHFMQNNISNNYADGNFTVIGNARAIRDGKLNPETLPAIGVWMDSGGKIWTLDHRRLAAMILSGKVETVKVRWVSAEEVNRQRYKMSTLSQGNYMLLTAKGRQSVIVEKPDSRGVEQRKITSRNVPRYDRSISPKVLKQTVWTETKGSSTIESQKILFSTTLSSDRSAIELSHLLKNGQAKIPALRVWVDSSNRMWTLDNDALAALKLSDSKVPVEVQYLSQEEYEFMNAKVDSQTGGRSYIIPLKEQNAALVVH